MKKRYKKTSIDLMPPTKEERDDTMSATATNFLYEIKSNTKNEKKEPLISKELLKLCENVAKKYDPKNEIF